MTAASDWSAADGAAQPEILRAAIVGSGLAGLCAAIQFEKQGLGPFLVFEKADDVGGVWRDNTYPGAGVDLPTCLYSYSFEYRNDWTRRYATQPEILRYIQRCAHENGLYSRIVFNTEIVRTQFDEVRGIWELSTKDGRSYLAQALIMATGQLNRPNLPEFDGMRDFGGVAFHSSEWDHSRELARRSVAVVGNGCSAVQLVPRIAAEAKRVTVFQRSAKWVIPKFDREFPAAVRSLFQTLPWTHFVRRAAWFAMAETIAYSPLHEGVWGRALVAQARLHLRRQIPDPGLRARLTPDFPFGCNRMILSNDYYPALMRKNVDLVTKKILRVCKDGIETADGTLHRADTIVFATGFRATDFLAPIEVLGPGGRLADKWHDHAAAYLGITVPGFPNLFILYGPNTGSANNSNLYMVESQVRYILDCLRVLGHRRTMEVRQRSFDEYQSTLGTRLRSTVWQSQCSSWYKTPSGKVTNLFPLQAYRYRLQTRRPDLRDYHLS